MVQCYASKNDAEEERKDFYSMLQSVLDKQKEKDKKYFNTTIGVNDSGCAHVMGKHGLGRMNENRELLADFLCIQQHGHRRQYLPSQEYPQCHLAVT